MAVAANTPIELVEASTPRLPERVAVGRRRLGRSLTLAEKILINHLDDPESQELERGRSRTPISARSRRDAGRHRADGAAAVHDRRPPAGRGAVDGALRPPHPARVDADNDLAVRRTTSTARSTTSCAPSRPSTASASGSPGSGIIHQVVLENYAFPGGMMIGTDCHTPERGRPRHDRHRRRRRGRGRRHGRLPVQRAVAEAHRRAAHRRAHRDGLRRRTSSSRSPRSSPSRAAPARSSSTSARVPPASRCTGKATICNMGAEIGATTSLFAYDDAMARYLKATGREDDRRRGEQGRARPARR